MRNIQTTYKPSTTQKVSYTSSSAATSNAFGSQIYIIRIVAKTDAFYVLGGSPTATTSDVYLPADTVEYISVTPGQKIAFIRDAADGDAFVTEMTL